MKRILLLFIASSVLSCGDADEYASELMDRSVTDITGEYFQMINHGAEDHWDDIKIKFTKVNTYEHGVRYIGDYDYNFPKTTIYWKEIQGNVETYHDFVTKWYCDGKILVLKYKDGSTYGIYRRTNYQYSALNASQGKFCE